MERVMAGMFELVGKIFGLRITERAARATGSGQAGSVEAWHPEVKFYELHDARGRHFGSFYADWHPRESKRGGAWMGYLVTGGPPSLYGSGAASRALTARARRTSATFAAT